jgi:hypothetical protein
MNWLKENPILVGLLGAALLILALGVYSITVQLAALGEQRAAFDAQVLELHKLQNQSPYPSKENLDKLQETIKDYKAELVAFEESIRKLQPPVPENITPQGFSDNLRKVVSAITAKANEAGVSLGENFYMGFNPYQTGLPSQAAAPYLQRQLDVLQSIMEKIIECKVTSVSITRAPLPVESGNKPQLIENKKPTPDGLIVRNPLDITIKGDQSRVRVALNSLLKAPQFLIIRALRVENSSKQAPSKVTDFSQGSQTTSSSDIESIFGLAQGVGEKKKETLPVILGRETITATLRIELVDVSPLNL